MPATAGSDPNPLAGLSRHGGCLLVGEVAQAHDGSLGTAHAYIDAIAEAGADAVKFQTHIAAAESTPAEPWRVRFSPQDESRYDYWRRMEFSEEQWLGLRRHAGERGLAFLSSPFSLEAVELLARVGVAAWKIASGEVGNAPLFDAIAATALPVILSTGMSSLEEIDRAVGRLRRRDLPLVLLQCSSRYPTPPEEVGLNMIGLFRERYGCGVGLSDHSGTIYAGLAAAALGIDCLEVHVTFHRGSFGPDVSSSLTVEELAQLVRGVRFIEAMRAHPVDKDAMAEELGPMRSLFTRSVVASRDLGAGTRLDREHLALKKPGTGVPPEGLQDLLGRRLRVDVAADEQIGPEQLEEEAGSA